MTYDLANMARARRIRALAALSGPRRARPTRARFFKRPAMKMPLAA
ncbi:hypothetical protein [Thalassococcus lentus]|uniref:Uncharacterized protein n=1 Tax=Thalassococcus lentus TaxID=1210524 RepID=A0ABT4XP97_9RHOB|nr:hypothetical protein [Thalassococcus lentus]MDA7423774.1 hypothetical protein [Thalassococcus lentus]